MTENLGRLIVEMNGGQPIKPPSIEKAESGRGWVMVDENGEVIQSFTTKRATTKAEDKAKKDQANALLAKAKQMETDQSPQKASYYLGDPILDSDVKGVQEVAWLSSFTPTLALPPAAIRICPASSRLRRTLEPCCPILKRFAHVKLPFPDNEIADEAPVPIPTEPAVEIFKLSFD